MRLVLVLWCTRFVVDLFWNWSLFTGFGSPLGAGLVGLGLRFWASLRFLSAYVLWALVIGFLLLCFLVVSSFPCLLFVQALL